MAFSGAQPTKSTLELQRFKTTTGLTDTTVEPASNIAGMTERVSRFSASGSRVGDDDGSARRDERRREKIGRDALMARTALGDEVAFAELYDELAPTLFGVVLRVLRDRAQSEEVTQDVFIELWRKAAQFDPARGGVHGWAVTIARRRAVDRVRGENARRDRERVDAAVPPAAPGSPVDAVIDTFDRERARWAVSELSDSRRHALELAFFDGLTHVEVAERLGVPLGTAKTWIRDGLIQLRRRLGVRG